ASLLQRDKMLTGRGEGSANGFIFGAMLRDKCRFAFVAEQACCDGDGAACVDDMDYRLAVVRRNLYGGMCAAGSCAADEQRHFEFHALHFARNVNHFVERRRNQTTEADDV